jgi:hypothetical protein
VFVCLLAFCEELHGFTVHQNTHASIPLEGSGFPVAHKLYHVVITGWLSNISGGCIFLIIVIFCMQELPEMIQSRTASGALSFDLLEFFIVRWILL